MPKIFKKFGDISDYIFKKLLLGSTRVAFFGRWKGTHGPRCNQNKSDEKIASDTKAVEKEPEKFRKQTRPDWFSFAWLVEKFKTQQLDGKEF